MVINGYKKIAFFLSYHKMVTKKRKKGMVRVKMSKKA